MTDYCVVLCTVPNQEVAHTIANELVSTHLAACVNIIPHLTSIYSWKNQICTDPELLLIIKTNVTVYKQLESAIKQLHPYEVPEIIVLPILAGSQDYLKWIDEVTKK